MYMHVIKINKVLLFAVITPADSQLYLWCTIQYTKVHSWCCPILTRFGTPKDLGPPFPTPSWIWKNYFDQTRYSAEIHEKPCIKRQVSINGWFPPLDTWHLQLLLSLPAQTHHSVLEWCVTHEVNYMLATSRSCIFIKYWLPTNLPRQAPFQPPPPNLNKTIREKSVFQINCKLSRTEKSLKKR